MAKSRESSTQRISNRCQHRWLLKTPNGPKVEGRCRVCGAQRVFETVPEDMRSFRPMVSQYSSAEQAEYASLNAA